MKSDTASQARIFLHKALHFIRIASENNHGIAAVIFHFLNDGIYCLVAVKSVPVFHQGIGFINEQHCSPCTAESILDQGRSMSHILTHQLGTPHLDHTAGVQQTVVFEYPCSKPCNCSFRSSGISGEDHAPGRSLDGQSALMIQCVESEKRDRPVDHLFHAVQTDHAVKLLRCTSLKHGLLSNRLHKAVIRRIDH